jgi:hypothetical protein
MNTTLEPHPIMNRPESGSAAVASRRVLIVLGMHRSGTSATTGALQCLGVNLGAKLYAGHQGINPKGYFEHSEVADLNDEVLLAMGSSWDDILDKPADWWRSKVLVPYSAALKQILLRDTSETSWFAIKDPRTCRLLPWWLAVLKEAGVEPVFLFAVRQPAEVYRSLEKRDGFSSEKAYLLWCLHYMEAEYWSRGHPRAALEFGAFLDTPADEMQRVEDALGIRFPRSVALARDELSAFVNQSLRHHASATTRDAPQLEALAAEVFDALDTARTSGSIDERRMDQLRDRLSTHLAGFSPLLVEQLRSTSHQRGVQQLTINRLMRSWSWYTGKPVRFIERLFGRRV